VNTEAITFLQTLDSETDTFLFQTFDDVKSRGDKNLIRTFYGTFEQHEERLASLNKLGAGIFVTVNKTIGNRRKKCDISSARAVWQEDDVATANIPKVEPNIVVETSPGHYHRYWLFNYKEKDFKGWQLLQDHMVSAYDSDPGAKDITRVLRLPGFINNKRDAAVKLISIKKERYEFEWLAREFGAIPGPKQSLTQIIADLKTETELAPPPQSYGTLAEYTAQILKGEHLHSPLRAIMMINANKGFDSEFNKVICLGLINSCPDEERKQKALADLDGMLRATYAKLSEEEDNDEDNVKRLRAELLSELGEKVDVDSTLPWPPGLMGELAQAANDFFVVPNKTAAIVTSLALIAGIAGRRYNISASGLNLYFTVMMETGAGKDSMRKFCQRVLMDKAMLGTNGLSFLGPQNFTGPKALLAELQTRPSMLCVMTEAGLLYRSNSGDGDGLTRIILQAYTSSGQYELIGTERYSSAQDTIQTVRSPALTILNEATPITLKAELKKRDSIDTGELPRMWIFELTGPKPFNNPNPHQLSLSPRCANRIKDLLQDCYTVQNSMPPDVINIPIPEQFPEYAEWCTDKFNELREVNPNAAVMYTRAAHKVLKTAAVISALEGNKHITKEQWDWTTKFFDYEQFNANPIVNATNHIDTAVTEAVIAIHKLLINQYKGPNLHIKPELRNQGIFTESPFKQLAERIPAIKNIGLDSTYGSPKSGARIVLEYMRNEGIIQYADVHSRASANTKDNHGQRRVKYKVTAEFYRLAKRVLVKDGQN
jgi:hypothetical protein